ncbi:MAG TPA: hypothetical protein O0Y02_04935 [Methanocorpusculum sp.]|nr:hypothetical protein [Methanocorpusculum sp.]
MNAVVLYMSKYGSTKQYAEWIAEELGADIFSADSFPPENFASYDTIIFGGPVFGGVIMGIAKISENMHILKEKRLIVFTVGITSPDADKILADLLEKNFSDSMMKHAETFHFQGALEYKKLTMGHKVLLKMINSSMKNKLDLHQNHVSRDTIMPLIESVRGKIAEE